MASELITQCPAWPAGGACQGWDPRSCWCGAWHVLQDHQVARQVALGVLTLGLGVQLQQGVVGAGGPQAGRCPLQTCVAFSGRSPHRRPRSQGPWQSLAGSAAGLGLVAAADLAVAVGIPAVSAVVVRQCSGPLLQAAESGVAWVLMPWVGRRAPLGVRLVRCCQAPGRCSCVAEAAL